MTIAEWIAVDWGTTNLRAWAMRGDQVVGRAASSDGMVGLRQGDYEPALLRLISRWLDRRMMVIACGMVGSRQGWAEAPYVAAPCLCPTDLVPVPVADHRLDVRLVPGVSQAAPADVMRGEETQIAGFLAQNPKFDGVICLPGTHTKWVHISASEIVSFRTFMTGEMFALLSDQSVLRHSVGTGWDKDSFAQAVSETQSKPETLAAKLFNLRAEGLLHSQSPDAARARLSGLLIGAEIAATRPYWLGQDVAVIGAPELRQIYAAALEQQGLVPRLFDASDMTLAGLTALRLDQKGCAA